MTLVAGPIIVAGLIVGLWLALASPRTAQAAPHGTRAAHHASVATPRRRSAGVRVSFPGGSAVPVPKSFFGLAMEWETVPLVARYPHTLEHLLGLFESRSSAPLTVRIGGLSADDSIWAPSPTTAVPPRALTITPPEIRELAAVVRGANLHLIVDLNVADDRPEQAAQLAAYVRHELPAGSITAFELGNEPDFYDHELRNSPAYYPSTFTAKQYATRFAAYARDLHRTVPHAALAGPALADPITNDDFMTTLLRSERSDVRMLTVHRYALSECAPSSSPWYPTLTRLLRNKASIGMVESMSRSVEIARAARLPIRLDETNSVTCGGTLGVSDTFASALWMTDTLFAALREGFTGVNVQSRVNAYNSPFYLPDGHLETRPLVYGMLLFTRALMPHARLVRTAVHEGPLVNLNAWALRSGTRTHVVLLNKGDAGRTVLLRLPYAAGAVHVQRMLASSLRTTSDVTLAGQHIDGTGRWAGRLRAVRATWTGHGYRVFMPAFSGALVSLTR